MAPIEIQETPDRDPIEIHIDVYKTVRVLCWDNWIFIGLNGLECSYKVPGCFAELSGHPWDDDFLVILLDYQNIMTVLTKQRFRRKHAHPQVFSQVLWAK